MPQVILFADELGAQLLQPARWPDRPRVVAEVSFDLAGDGGDGVCREAAPAAAPVGVGRLEQGHASHLDEVLDVHPPATEAPGHPVREVQGEEDGLASQLVPTLDRKSTRLNS